MVISMWIRLEFEHNGDGISQFDHINLAVMDIEKYPYPYSVIGMGNCRILCTTRCIVPSEPFISISFVSNLCTFLVEKKNAKMQIEWFLSMPGFQKPFCYCLSLRKNLIQVLHKWRTM